MRVGTNFYCQNTACERFTLPCPHAHMDVAYTEDEHEAALERQRDADATGYSRTTESPSYRSQMVDAGRGHLLP